MTYQLSILPKAEKALRKLSRNEFIKIDAAILKLSSDARPVGCKKLQGGIDIYRIRVGDYRIVYNIQDDLLIIEVIRIAQRGDVYKNLG